MSHHTKERKTREKRVERLVQGAHRSDDTRARHYLTTAKRKTKCERCPRRFLVDDELVYRHSPRQVLCVDCATALGIKWRTSRRWEQARGKRRSRPRAERRMHLAPQELLAWLVIEAGRTPKGGFTRSMTDRWGVSWPLQKGWRRELVELWAHADEPVPAGPLEVERIAADAEQELDRDLDQALGADVVTARPGTIGERE